MYLYRNIFLILLLHLSIRYLMDFTETCDHVWDYDTENVVCVEDPHYSLTEDGLVLSFR